jgi:hypothetical protein
MIQALGIYHAGQSYLDEINDAPCTMPDIYEHGQEADDLDEEDETHLALAWGANILGVRINSFEAIEALYLNAKQAIDGAESKYGASPQFRIRADLLHDSLYSDSDLKPFTLIVLAAILSSIGNGKFKQVSRKTILWRVHGCKTGAMFKSEVSNPWVTDWSIRAAVDELIRRKILKLALVNNRWRFYSVALSQVKLDAAVLSKLKDDAAKKAKRDGSGGSELTFKP